MSVSEQVQAVLDELAEAVGPLRFGPPVTHVYNPLLYAREPLRQYVARFATGKKEVVLVGMNPGPWGMAQTGVPFGEVNLVREWLGIEGPVEKPAVEHPKRPVLGFACSRREVSGSRIWGWAKAHFGTPERFFERFYVHNYCPLLFLEESGRNRTPDKLKAAERAPLLEVCDRALARVVQILRPGWVIGVGRFSESRARTVLDALPVRVGSILHPSPASPLANRGWAELATQQLGQMGVGSWGKERKGGEEKRGKG